MRNGFRQISCILHFIGNLLEILGLILLFPLIVVFVCWGQSGDGWVTSTSFVIASVISFSLGMILRHKFKPSQLNPAGSMLICALSWLVVSAIGAIPFVIATRSNYLDGYFESMSGFTTTGITIFSGLDSMPRSIIFWRALSQWLGGIGILSFFLVITFQVGGAHHILGAESHKISSRRLTPGLFHTIRIIWTIYVVLTVLAAVVFAIERMPVFDSICHALTGVATGGFSPYDSSIEHYFLTGHPNYRLIEYTLIVVMMLGGINFLVHYRLVSKDFKALWDNVEIRYWWRLIIVFVVVIMAERLYRTGAFEAVFRHGTAMDLGEVERSFRHSLFQVISILTTSGFTTKSIDSDFFYVAAKQLFLVMMVIGGCVGSTSGGFKVLRIAILNRLMFREVFKLRASSKASKGLIVDGKILPEDEAHRISALFFTWMALLVFGGVITALFSNHSPWVSFSGMFSAVGNIGPCYIPTGEMMDIHPVVKITYIFGMLAGRLEIIPVLLLFSRKAWR
jgi:trk system potassium uptake protein